jgi:drug/metabolite transporter (DMT)-like permease
MDSFVFLAVLFAAACHASWNALIKVGLDPFTTTALIAVASGIVALPFVPIVGFPPSIALPWVLASVILHLGYYIGLTEAYRSGDLGQVYPIARGAAPLLTALLSTTFYGEHLGALGWAGLLLLVCGVFALSLRGGSGLGRLNSRAVAFALFTAITICGYSLVDGIGARVSGNAHAYAVTLFVLDALSMAVFTVARRGPEVIPLMLRYCLVAALRETSVLFGTGIAVVVLREPLRAVRIVAALVIVTGLALIRLH